MPSLSDTIAALAGVGGVLGAAGGLAVRPSSDREMIDNVVKGAQLGAVVGTAFALAFWIAGTAAGA